MSQFIKRQIRQIRHGGSKVLLRKINLLIVMITKLPLYILAIPAVLIIRLIRPLLLVRFVGLISTRIGHLGGNPEIYLCEQDAGINLPNQRYIDIFYMAYKPICNEQLATMWRRVLCVWPAWIMTPIYWINRLIPGGQLHEIGNNTQHDRDVHNLLDRVPPHLKFTDEEDARGVVGLRAIGIPAGGQFVCLNVRDSAYLSGNNWDYHNYRDSDIQNYVLAAEELANRGYYVVRMGAKVHASIISSHPKVIDYANNGIRSDFMDIYLGSKCAFCISTGSGWEIIPAWIFRRPICYVNHCPLGYFCTWFDKTILLTKHYIDMNSGHELTLSEIFTRDVGFCMLSSDYESKGVELIENTPEEIRDVAIEMEERLAGTWQAHADDETLQQRFWEIFPTDAADAYAGKPLHGEIRSRFGSAFLRNNQEWLQ